MATIQAKTFDIAHGAVFLDVQDAILGNVTKHTLYVALTPDVDASIAQILTDADANAHTIKNGMIAAGWVPNGN